MKCYRRTDRWTDGRTKGIAIIPSPSCGGGLTSECHLFTRIYSHEAAGETGRKNGWVKNSSENKEEQINLEQTYKLTRVTEEEIRDLPTKIYKKTATDNIIKPIQSML